MRRARTAVVLAVLLLAASPLTARDLEITFWHSMGYHVRETIDRMTADFNRAHPGIRVKPVYQGFFEDVQVKMLAAAVSRQLPDVAHVPLEFLQPYVDNRLVEPITGSIPEHDLHDIIPQAWEAVSRDGEIYGVPFCFTTDVLFYNADAFREVGLSPDSPPDTWEELVEQGKRLTRDTDGDGRPDTYAMMFYLNGFYGLMPILWSNGGELFTGGGLVDLTSRPMRRSVRMVHELLFTHRIMPRQWTPWESGQAFLSGNLAMGWFTSAAISYGERNLPWELRVAHMPSINGERATMLGGAALVNFARNRKKRQAVQEFALWFAEKENMIRLFEEVGFVPVRRSALDSLQVRSFIRKNPNYRVPLEALEYARHLPRHAQFYKINREFGEMLQRIVLQGTDPEEELRRTEARINRMLRE
ncbi:MAG: ABC transporter substrate-binding protein [Spirochaetota bacterium]